MLAIQRKEVLLALIRNGQIFQYIQREPSTKLLIMINDVLYFYSKFDETCRQELSYVVRKKDRVASIYVPAILLRFIKVVGFFTSADGAERIGEGVQAERAMFQRDLLLGSSKLPVSYEQ